MLHVHLEGQGMVEDSVFSLGRHSEIAAASQRSAGTGHGLSCHQAGFSMLRRRLVSA